ncbi:MAG: 2-C-methyl-D-erythritol 2,4-cyclodiphosphate synthase [Terriglobales bacterium]
MTDATPFRVGQGWDSHRFVPARPLWLGGVRIPHDRGLAGHSDGDVLLHALTDALLGALALGDIGTHFPPEVEAWRDAASAQFVRHAVGLAQQRGWRIANVDAVVILERPKLAPFRPALQAAVASLLGVEVGQVSIKAKTPEGLPWADLAVAECVVLLYRPAPAPTAPAIPV